MTVLFVSPAEPARVRDMCARKLPGHTIQQSLITEQRGVDFLWRERGQWWGVQRKELADLLASMTDGRLAKEVGQMHDSVTAPVVVIERHPRWTADGSLVDDQWRTEFTYKAWCGLIMSLHAGGIGVIQTQGIGETVDTVGALIAWSAKPSHTSTSSRPGPSGNSWGKASSRDWSVHMLQGLPGVGAGVAAAVVDHFGRVPIAWTVDESELLAVPGVGPGRAKKMIAALT